MSSKVLVIMAGGTGGHIFPGLAVADKYREKGWQIHWIGTADRMEADIVPKYDIPLHFIDVKGVRGNGIARLLKAPFMLLNAFMQARKILSKLKPNLVIGFGGYASGPGGLAAKSLGLPLVIHEQNAVLGMTNKYLSKMANKTLLAFPLFKHEKNSDSWPVVGNPVRAEIAGLNQHAKKQLTAGEPVNILIIGGSLGARALNLALPKLLTELSQTYKLKVQHQAGKGNADSVASDYQQQGSLEVEVKEFIDDMTTALQSADLVICRAGALTVSELAASGNVGIFVPLPHAVDDHQTANANWLVSQDAGVLVPQQTLEEQLPKVLADLLSQPERINDMQKNAAAQANLTTTDSFYQLCQKLELNS
jgi:UDP-N-acetylglucosamine--N-acetylmuramyl-(pentapeptide) pyrophosphoryl-undecaprenol N-acetylglucosamine transferase